MSIVNVALLKNVIDQGPENNKYYMVSLVMISLSLGLQIFAGILSLIIEHMVTYLSKYGQNMCEDFKENCCPWRCVRAPRKTDDDDVEVENGPRPRNHIHIGHMGKQTSAYELYELWEASEALNVAPVTRKDRSGDCGCCPFICTTEVYSHYDYSALQKYYQWKCKSVDVELDAIKAEDELEYHTELVNTINEKLSELRKDTPRAEAPGVVDEAEVAKLTEELKDAERKQAEFAKVLRKSDTVRNQGKLLKDFAEATREQRVVMLSAFWQQILNYVFFLIFILNAFITGIGLASPSTDTLMEDGSTDGMVTNVSVPNVN